MPRAGAMRRGLGSARSARAGRSRSGRVQAGTSLMFRTRIARAAAGIAAVALSCAACTPAGNAGGQPSPTRRPITAIVQLGDSFSSGNGAGTYEEDTCRRSPDTYSAPLARELGASYTNASCSGARTSDIAEHVSAVTPATSVVFLTAGGNDANFAQIISSCFVLRAPNSCEEAMNTATAALPAIETATLEILRSIDTASHGQATVILVGSTRGSSRNTPTSSHLSWKAMMPGPRSPSSKAPRTPCKNASSPRCGKKPAPSVSSSPPPRHYSPGTNREPKRFAAAKTVTTVKKPGSSPLSLPRIFGPGCIPPRAAIAKYTPTCANSSPKQASPSLQSPKVLQQHPSLPPERCYPRRAEVAASVRRTPNCTPRRTPRCAPS